MTWEFSTTQQPNSKIFNTFLFLIFRFSTNPDQYYKLPKQDNLQVVIYFMLLMGQTDCFINWLSKNDSESITDTCIGK